MAPKVWVWIGFNEDGSLKCQITKFLGEDKIREIGKVCEAEKGDLVLIIADKPKVVAQALGELRLEMARRMGLIDPNEFLLPLGHRLPDVRIQRRRKTLRR